jgi:CxxC motif-containing protein (DUF1111 family)
LSHLWKRRRVWVLSILLLAALRDPLAGQQTVPVLGSEFGDPLPGISARELEIFRIGLEDMLEVETAPEGLGPVFNGRSCAECHSVPAVGGSGTITEVRAGILHRDGRFEELPGGSVFQMFSLPFHELQARIPEQANVVARRRSLQLFGLGLVEAVSESALLALADPDDENGDGISGRVNVVRDPANQQMRAGRFGWKAQQATLLAFGAEAYRDEMGITNELFPLEACPYGVDCEMLAFLDLAPDPEDLRDRVTGLRGIDAFEAFLRFIGPPPRGPIDATAEAGERVFLDAGCGSCHVPSLTTGDHPSPALRFKRFFPYGDFLLHDVGTGDGIAQGEAGPHEIRTPPLWGLRLRAPFLHDGSAPTIAAAIERHAGEAEAARKRYLALERPDLDALLEFLRSL